MGSCISSEKKKLRKCTYENTAPFYPKIKNAVIVKWFDGDTVWLGALIDGEQYRFSARMYGYDSPEMKSHDQKVKEKAIQARDALKARTKDRILKVEIIKTHEKYGRLLVKLYDDKGCLNDWMIKEGHGVPYHGGKKFTEEDWKNE